MRGRLDRGKPIELFEDLAEHLRERGVRGHIYIVGGAAMMLALGRSRTTRDVGAYVRNQGTEHADVMEAVWRVAGKHGLPEDWLNELATMFMPSGEASGEDRRAPVLFDSPHLAVTGASAEHMLAMELQAGREATSTTSTRCWTICRSRPARRHWRSTTGCSRRRRPATGRETTSRGSSARRHSRRSSPGELGHFAPAMWARPAEEPMDGWPCGRDDVQRPPPSEACLFLPPRLRGIAFSRARLKSGHSSCPPRSPWGGAHPRDE